MTSLLSIIELVKPYALHIAVFGASLIVVVSFLLREKRHAPDIASFATTTGIFFTFLGIVLALGGLTNLQEKINVQDKIEALLGGIFVAFIPSIFGALVAVITHVRPTWFPSPPINDDQIPSGVDEQILQELRNLNKNLIGDSDASLATRLEKFQLKVTENQDSLRKEFQDFAEKVADEIMNALKESMAQLNEKLGEQFGENFAKFADAIPKLLDWQAQYLETIENTQIQLKAQSDHLKELLNTLDSSQKSFIEIASQIGKIAEGSSNIESTIKDISDGLTKAVDSITKMKDNSEQFQVSATQLASIMEKQAEQATRQSVALEKSAESITTVANNASVFDEKVAQLTQYFADIAGHVNTISEGSKNIDSTTKDISDNLMKAVDSIVKMKDNSDQFQVSATQLASIMEKQTEQATKQAGALEKSADSITTVANKTNILDDTAKQLNFHVDALNTAIQTITSGLGSVERLSATMEGKAESIEKNMKNITDEAVKNLAGNLRGISEALVKDYSEVRNAMEKIVSNMTRHDDN